MKKFIKAILFRCSRALCFFYFKKIKTDINLHNNGRAKKDYEEIDVLIPVSEKDIEVLGLTIESIRKFSLNRIANIYLVAKNTPKIRFFAKENNCLFIDEDGVCNVKLNQIYYSFKGVDRSGWLFQQLIKLNWDKISQKKNCLILDADTIFLGPQIFVDEKKLFFNCSDEFHQPYFECFEKILNEKRLLPLSFISHYMIFDRESTLELKQEIEKKCKMNWEFAILKNCTQDTISGFSEYETYGHFLYNRKREMLDISYWRNISVKRSSTLSLNWLIDNYSKRHKTISFHWHLQ